MIDRKNQITQKMQCILDRCDIHLKVKWTPKAGLIKHGEITSGVLSIYDKNESEAWSTFVHEILEFRLQSVTAPYRMIINLLIDVFEKMCYQEKEVFLERVPRLLEKIKQEKANSNI